MAKEYEISVPVMGVAKLTVIAESAEAALAEAISIAGPDEVDVWEAYPVIVEGNVYYGPLNRARIDNEYDLEDDDAAD